jgi:hypothetical protein
MQYTSETKSLPPAKFLTIAANLLNNALLKPDRAEAKRVFKDIQQGKVVPLTYLELEDKALVRFDLELNHQRYRGDLNFSSFRTGLALLLSNAGKTLENPESLHIYQADGNPRSILFGVVAITSVNDEPSVLVLGADSSGDDASVRLTLTYLDSVQFEENLAAGDESAPS